MVNQAIIKVLVVDDSAFMRKLIQEFLSEHKQIAVVGTARNGQDALAKIKLLRPHVLTMDVEMPVMSGLDALKEIMQVHPLPVIMLSSTTTSGTENTLLAMDYGAVDFVAKPSGTISLDLHKVKEELVRKVLTAAEANVYRKTEVSQPSVVTDQYKPDSADSSHDIIKKEVLKETAPERLRRTSKPSGNKKKLVLIGTSTGGPRALQQVISSLPKEIHAPVVVVQHMPAGFTNSLANRLNSLSEVTVKEAEHGEALINGTVYIAPGGYHIVFSQNGSRLSIQLNDYPQRNGHRPSVDVMFESAALLKNIEKIAVIMTGMGSDGSKGLVQLNYNGLIGSIAESQESCIVYGMPKAALATGLIDEECHLTMISTKIVNYLL